MENDSKENFFVRMSASGKRKLEFVLAMIRGEAALRSESINQAEAFERLIGKAYKDAGGPE